MSTLLQPGVLAPIVSTYPRQFLLLPAGVLLLALQCLLDLVAMLGDDEV
jgi:hypothetical protein